MSPKRSVCRPGSRPWVNRQSGVLGVLHAASGSLPGSTIVAGRAVKDAYSGGRVTLKTAVKTSATQAAGCQTVVNAPLSVAECAPGRPHPRRSFPIGSASPPAASSFQGLSTWTAIAQRRPLRWGLRRKTFREAAREFAASHMQKPGDSRHSRAPRGAARCAVCGHGTQDGAPCAAD